MALLHVNYWSSALEKQSGAYVILPDGEGPFRVVYQLHGLSDDYTIWLRRTSIERYAEKAGMMVVLLDGGRSFYVDTHPGLGRYESHILETVRFMDRTFRTIPGPEGRAIGGLSMGGYGAVKLGLKYPDIFGSVASHSGALDIAALCRESLCAELQVIFPNGKVRADEDPFVMAAKPLPKPALYFDCGVNDFLIEQNRRFHAHLQNLGVAHTYKEFPGEHTWEYWDKHIVGALMFHNRHLSARK